jgi:hypothetical protein
MGIRIWPVFRGEKQVSVDIGIGDGTSMLPVAGEPSLGFINDGYYWFLYPYFEHLRSGTGQYIDLYGDASFSGSALDALDQMLLTVRDIVLSQPPTWQVCTGSVLPEQEKVYQMVNRDTMLKKLDLFAGVISRAKELGCPVVCYGD